MKAIELQELQRARGSGLSTSQACLLKCEEAMSLFPLHLLPVQHCAMAEAGSPICISNS